MAAGTEAGATPASGRTNVERISEREVAVTRTFDAPARIVFAAWTTPALFMRWWAPKSIGVPLLACEMDVRTGGTYRLTFGHDEENAMSFYGKYIEVIPNARIVWTNDEGDEAGAVTTVTFVEDGGRTLLTYNERYPTREGLEENAMALEFGQLDGLPEQFAQLDEVLGELGAGG